MRNKKKSAILLFKAGISLLLICLVLPGYAFSQAPFYEGKTIKLVLGRRPGGTGDMRIRALIPFLQKYIPGNPNIVSLYMPGAGGRKAANYIYTVAKPDGLTLANASGGVVPNAILGQPGVRYDIDKFIFLGSANSRSNYIFLTRSDLGLDTLEKLQAASGLRIGGQSVGTNVYNQGRLFAWFLDLKNPKFVVGYSGPEIDLAIFSGELDARPKVSGSLLRRNKEDLEKGRMHLHVIIEIPEGYRQQHPAFEPLPALHTFAKTEHEKKLLQMYANFRLVGSPSILHPDTPRDRVKILKAAFSKALMDPGFAKSYKKLTGADPQPLLPDEQAKTVREIPRDGEIIELFKKLAGAGPLPPR